MKNKLYKDKDWLYDQYHNKKLFQEQIADLCGTNQARIWYWMKKFGIESRNRGFKKGHHFGNRYSKGEKPWNFGKSGYNIPPLSEEHKKKISDFAKTRIGKLAAHWKGGKSDFKESIYANHRYNEWRTSVFERDNWTCKICGYDKGGILQAHHIKTVKQIIIDNNLKDIYGIIKCKELWNVGNGITLCRKCHENIFGKESIYQDNFLNLIKLYE